jgi:hypothetical protein
MNVKIKTFGMISKDYLRSFSKLVPEVEEFRKMNGRIL